METLKVGGEYTEEEVRNALGVGPYGGIRVNEEARRIVLFSEHMREASAPYYEDFWDTHKRILHYTGEGQVGDQKMEGGNRLLAAAGERRYAVHLFETYRPGRHTYQGTFDVLNYYIDRQADAGGGLRKVYVFKLRPHGAAPSLSRLRGARLVVVVAAIVRRGGLYLVARRKKDSALEPSKWEFPGGKVELKESPEACLEREIREEMGIEIRAGEIFHAVTHVFRKPGGLIHMLMLCYLCDHLSGEGERREVQDFRWVALEEMGSLDWAKADVAVVERLLACFGQNR